MKELKDYSGEFTLDLRHEDFSKAMLIELLKMYSTTMRAIDGLWYLSVKERQSNEDALACDMWVWQREKKKMLEMATKLLKIEGAGVSPVMKYLQVDPWLWDYKYGVELKNINRGLLTVAYCPTLDALEREGEGREKKLCPLVCGGIIYRQIADFYNPDIELNSLKLPPRRNKDEICCQWEYKLRTQGRASPNTTVKQ